MYDYLIVGAGISGATFARVAAEDGKKVLVIDKSDVVGGLSKTITDKDTGIIVHKFGPHIFHTSSSKVWKFVNRFCNMMPFVNTPMAKVGDSIYNLPINMNTISRVFNITDPQEAIKFMENEVENYEDAPSNFEEACKSKVGTKLFEMFFKGYTEKQWHADCTNVPADVFSSRQPIRFTYNNNYFNDIYQGIPYEGYTEMITNMLCHENIDVALDTEYDINSNLFANIANKVVYTGTIDRLFNYCEGCIRYNSLNFENVILDINNFQGNAVVNYCDADIPYTRITEHKFFNTYNEAFNSDHTIITYETPQVYVVDKNVPMYPVAAGKNTYSKYLKYIPDNMILLGRLATFEYLNMDTAIERAMAAYDTDSAKED